MATESYDIVIIGGGIIGSSIAYHLMSRDNSLKLAVVERDPTYTHASSSLSMVMPASSSASAKISGYPNTLSLP